MRAAVGLAAVAAAALLPVLAGAAPPDSSRATWYEARTAHFTVMADAPDRAADVAARFERLTGVLAAIHPGLPAHPAAPVRVVAFRDTAAMAPYRPPGFENAEASFLAAGEQNFIVMSGDGVGGDGSSALIHEYVHACLHGSFPGLPLWVNEGLAIYFSFVRESRDSVDVGRMAPRLAARVPGGRRIPIAELFEFHTGSAAYRGDHPDQLRFYVESWALVHYLISGSPRNRERFGRVLDAVRGGAAALPAFERAFPRSEWNALQAALPAHLASRRPARRVALARAGADSVRIHPLPPEEAARRLSELRAAAQPAG